MNSKKPHFSTRPDFDSEEGLGELLRSLPREQATFGFEERVLRKARAAPKPPFTLIRGFRLAAPLAVAATLGFVVGPSLMDRSSSTPGSTQAGSELAIAAQNGGSRPADSVTGLRSERAVPSVTSAPSNAQIVGMPGVGGNPAARVVGNPSLEQIRSETARVRRELEQLRSTRAEAGATVAFTMANGVEVQIDVRDLYEVLQQRAEAFAQMEREALRQRESTAAAAASSLPESSDPEIIEPPLW